MPSHRQKCKQQCQKGNRKGEGDIKNAWPRDRQGVVWKVKGRHWYQESSTGKEWYTVYDWNPIMIQLCNPIMKSNYDPIM